MRKRLMAMMRRQDPMMRGTVTLQVMPSMITRWLHQVTMGV